MLVRQLAGLVVFDDVGRRCVTRDTARGLFAERAAAERQQREVSERNAAKLAEVADENRPRGGAAVLRAIPEALDERVWLGWGYEPDSGGTGSRVWRRREGCGSDDLYAVTWSAARPHGR